MRKFIGSILFIVFSVLPTFAQNTTIESFSKAKRLAADVYAGHEQTFYCGCVYNGKTVDFASCGYIPKGKPETAKRLEWEHVVPAENFGRSFPEWREGSPKCVNNKRKPFKGWNFLLTLWQQQKGRCAHCGEAITPDTGWHDHHKRSRLRGGTDARVNHVLLHPNCHMSVHHASDSLCKPHSVTRVFGKA